MTGLSDSVSSNNPELNAPPVVIVGSIQNFGKMLDTAYQFKYITPDSRQLKYK